MLSLYCTVKGYLNIYNEHENQISQKKEVINKPCCYVAIASSSPCGDYVADGARMNF